MVGEDGLFEIMYSCRAMRRLSSQPVPEDVLLKLVEAAGQAASGSNKQLGRWIIVRDAEQKRRIAELNKQASEVLVEGRIERGESLAHHDTETRARMLKSVLWIAHHMHEISTLMVPCYEFESKPSAEALASAHSSLWPGVQNLLLAARAKGLGAVLTSYALSNYEAFADILDLPEKIVAFGVIPVGYPLGNFGPVTRLPVRDVTWFDRYS